MRRTAEEEKDRKVEGLNDSRSVTFGPLFSIHTRRTTLISFQVAEANLGETSGHN